MKLLLIIISLLGISSGGEACQQRWMDEAKQQMVCVCSAENCDPLPKIDDEPPEQGKIAVYISNKDGKRMERSEVSFQNATLNGIKIIIQGDQKKQTLIGYGGAFTDSAGINILSLSKKSQDFLLRDYFTKDGLNYNMGRVPIGGSDFSTRPYSYRDAEEENVQPAFNLTSEDYLYKFPIIKEARRIHGSPLKLLGAAWSPPLWMKSNNDWSGFSWLRKEYYQDWADYHLKFLEAYSSEGVNDIWAISTGNEPSNGLIPLNRFNSLGWLPNNQADWVAQNLGPTICSSKFNGTKILALDDQRFFLPWWLKLSLANGAKEFVDGIALHWYWDTIFPASLLDKTHDLYPNMLLLATEASYGDKPWIKEKVLLGSWDRGEAYLEDIISDLNHWIVSWLDWNLALNLEGGPTWAGNFIDSAIIVNSTADEYYKQPMWYALGHITRFAIEGSVVIQSDVEPSTVKAVAVNRPDGLRSVIVMNSNEGDIPLVLVDGDRQAQITIPSRSFLSLIYQT